MSYLLTDYISSALASAEYDELDDASFVGRIPECKGVIAFGASLSECENELRATLEGWILLGLKMGHDLPVINGINLNGKPRCESLVSV